MEKKRVFVCVDKEAWEGSQQILKELRISNQLFNAMLNEFIRTQYLVLVGIKQKRDSGEELSMGSFLRMMGTVVDNLDSAQMKLVK